MASNASAGPSAIAQIAAFGFILMPYRLYVPVGEDFFSQVRIYRVNRLRTAAFIPPLADAEYVPDELQVECVPTIVNGQSVPVCDVRTGNCPGNTVVGVCGRVVDVMQGDGLQLSGANYFDVNAKVRLLDKDTQTITRDVDAYVFGDTTTPREESVGGETRLINDCRVQDQLTFQVPADLPLVLYMIQVVVPNSTGNSAFGTELVSNTEFINVLPPPTARYQIAIDRIIAREETSPAFWGSDEVGLRTVCMALNLANDPSVQQTTSFEDDLDGVDFDSGTARTLGKPIFTSDGPLLALAIGVMGHEIDSDRAYHQQINDWTDYFVDAVKKQWEILIQVIGAGGGLGALKGLTWQGLLAGAIVAAVVLAIDLIVSDSALRTAAVACEGSPRHPEAPRCFGALGAGVRRPIRAGNAASLPLACTARFPQPAGTTAVRRN